MISTQKSVIWLEIFPLFFYFELLEYNLGEKKLILIKIRKRVKKMKKTCSNLFKFVRASKVFFASSLLSLNKNWTQVCHGHIFSRDFEHETNTLFLFITHAFFFPNPRMLSLYFIPLPHTHSHPSHIHTHTNTNTHTLPPHAYTHKYKHTQNECEQHIFPFVKSIDNIWIEFSAEEEKRKAFLTDIVTETKVFPKLRNVLFTF